MDRLFVANENAGLGHVPKWRVADRLRARCHARNLHAQLWLLHPRDLTLHEDITFRISSVAALAFTLLLSASDRYM